MEYKKNRIIGICSICVIAMIIYLSSKDHMYIQNKAETYKRIHLPQLLCDNILTNITNGKWIKRIDLVDNDFERQQLTTREHELERLLAEFRINRGMHNSLWRDDDKCGYKVFQSKPKRRAWGDPVGAWCDATSQKPCCDSNLDGVCGTVCDCANCTDMRNIYHAEISEWVLLDKRCRPRNYTSYQACKVLENIEEIYFVGDSFMRKMLRGLVLI